jgi:hypothetical protein
VEQIMTDSTDPTTSDVTVDPSAFGDELDAWLGGATLARRSVDIYARPDLYAEYQDLERQLELAGKSRREGDVEESLEDSAAADIEQKLVELHAQWMASKSTWVVRGLPREVYRELSKEHPEVKAPAQPPADADDETRAAYKSAVDEWAASVDARNYAILEQAVVEVRLASGKITTVDIDPTTQLVATPLVNATRLNGMRSSLGEWQFIKLINASKLAATQEPVIPAPFLRSSSKTAKT